MWFSPNQSIEARSRGIFSPCCIKMPVIFCLKLLSSESLEEQLPRHIWLNWFSEASSQSITTGWGWLFAPSLMAPPLHSQPADPTMEANSRAQAFSSQQLEIAKQKQFHGSQLMSFTLLLGLTLSRFGFTDEPYLPVGGITMVLLSSKGEKDVRFRETAYQGPYMWQGQKQCLLQSNAFLHASFSSIY